MGQHHTSLTFWHRLNNCRHRCVCSSTPHSLLFLTECFFTVSCRCYLWNSSADYADWYPHNAFMEPEGFLCGFSSATLCSLLCFEWSRSAVAQRINLAEFIFFAPSLNPLVETFSLGQRSRLPHLIYRLHSSRTASYVCLGERLLCHTVGPLFKRYLLSFFPETPCFLQRSLTV